MQQTNAVELNLTVFSETGVLLREARHWDLLRDRADMPTHHHAWLESCIRSFGSAEKPAWVVIGGNQPRAIAPLMKRGRFARLIAIGVDELYEPTAFPNMDAESLTALASAVANLGRALFLKRVPADSPLIPALKEAYRRRGIVLTRPVAGCPWIPLDSGWKDPESKLSAGRRSSLKRARRNAESLGPVEWEFCPAEPIALAKGLEEAFRVESAGWKGRSGTALLSDERRRAFYESYIALAGRGGIARLCFLRIAGKAVAMQVAVECADRYWLLKVGYDEAFSRCAPGNLLMLETIRYAASRGFQSYEFLGTAEPWTTNWTDQVRACVSLSAYPITFPGVAALASDAFRVGLHRVASHWKK